MIPSLLTALFFTLLDMATHGFATGAPLLSWLFLFYSGFRRPFHDVVALGLWSCLAFAPFTATGFAVLFVCHCGIFLLVSRLRERIIAEAYLTQALWTVVGVFFLRFALDFCVVTTRAIAPNRFFQGVLPALVCGGCAVPFFLFCDRFFERRAVRRRGGRSPVF